MSPRYSTRSGRPRAISRATSGACAPPALSPTAQRRTWLVRIGPMLGCCDAAVAAAQAASAVTANSGTRRAVISRPLPARWLVELPDSEDLRPAVGAGALNCRATVLHGHLLRILDLDLLLLLDAITLRHNVTS